MNFRIALTAAATLALAACGSTEDASTEAEADTVEIAADDALADVEAEPVEDPAANDVAETPDLSPSETAQIQEAGDNAADTAAAAMDAMSQDASN
ncbi:MAG: hypothetical protein V7664_11375 [Qipengyuania sp.]|jgi:hypothetical protein|uniref:hypothetical protein n=1 Tax=Qipengyuania sp. TaxID=2004515 RepID=UPI0030013B9D